MPDTYNPRPVSNSNVPAIADNFDPTTRKTGSDGLGGKEGSKAVNISTQFDPTNNFADGVREGPSPEGQQGLSEIDHRPAKVDEFNVLP